tara:strand:+ start:2263 stop:2547 length:285 start_codon:yes stop_codon:yes gene_type:complete
MDINLTLKDETVVLPQDLTIKRWDWLVSNLKCNESCEIFIRLYCDLDEPDDQMPLGYCVKNVIYKLEGDEYAAWAADDTYITNIALREIGKLSN